MKNTAILITCYNRKEKTILCLQNLHKNFQNFTVYLINDGSTDGTSDDVKRLFPAVKIIQGSGNLYWNRGMRLAWQEAAKQDYEYYLWLNDDVYLYENAFDELLQCSTQKQNKAIISGLIETKEGKIIYGGYDENKKIIQANSCMNPIKYMNGNVVLVPKHVFHLIGMLDGYFHHDLGDVDYGLRAIANEVEVCSTRVAVAQGEVNPMCRERLNGTTLKKRFKKLYSPLGSNPRINFYFRKKHFSIINAIVYFIFQHFLNLIPDGLNNFLFKEKYS